MTDLSAAAEAAGGGDPWVLIILGFFGLVSTCFTVYFGYKQHTSTKETREQLKETKAVATEVSRKVTSNSGNDNIGDKIDLLWHAVEDMRTEVTDLKADVNTAAGQASIAATHASNAASKASVAAVQAAQAAQQAAAADTAARQAAKDINTLTTTNADMVKSLRVLHAKQEELQQLEISNLAATAEGSAQDKTEADLVREEAAALLLQMEAHRTGELEPYPLCESKVCRRKVCLKRHKPGQRKPPKA